MRRKRRPRKQSNRADADTALQPQRLQKFLAALGLGSRREIENWILEGRITIDKHRARVGQKISGAEQIRIDGRPLKISVRTEPRPRLILYNKPEGELVSRFDSDGRATVFDKLPRLRGARWIAVGRLDLNSRGLLLLTTDGELAHRLTHPRYAVEREYAVRVLGAVGSDALARLAQGMELEDGPARFERVEWLGGEGANQWYQVTLMEGRNREVRRLWEAVGARVSRLIRVRYGCIRLPRELRAGNYQTVDAAARKTLYGLVGMDPPLGKPARRFKPGVTHAGARPGRSRRN